MQKRNFGQAKRAKENARKERQQKKLERRHSKTAVAPAEENPPSQPANAEEKPAQ